MTESTRERDVGRFDEWAETYGDSWLQAHLFERVHRATLDAAADAVDPPERVLDVGCGTGRLLERARERFPDAELVGVDPARRMVAEARRDSGSARAVTGTAESLPLADDSVALALTTMSFHHWTDQRRGLAEVERVLRPDGRLVLADAVVDGVVRVALGFYRPGRFHTPAEFTRLFERAGLDVTDRRWVSGLHSGENGVAVTVGRRRD